MSIQSKMRKSSLCKRPVIRGKGGAHENGFRSSKGGCTGNYLGTLKRRKNRMPVQSGLQSGEQVYALLAQRGQVPANAAEGNRSCFAAERAGDLLLHLDHAHISLGLVIIKRHGEVGEEGENGFFAHLKPVQQVDSRMALACRLGRTSTGEAPIGSPAFLEQAIILSPQSEQGKGIQTPFASLLGFLHALFHHQEQLLQVSGPWLLVCFLDEGQLAQMMDITESMGAVFIQEVRTAAIMNRSARKLWQDPNSIQGFSPALGMHGIMRQVGRTGDMQPSVRCLDVEASLILVQDGSLDQGLLDSLFDPAQVGCTALNQSGQTPFRELDAQQIAEDFTGSGPGHKLLLDQIDRYGCGPGSILDRGIHPAGERGQRHLAARGTPFVFRLMFLRDQPGYGDR